MEVTDPKEQLAPESKYPLEYFEVQVRFAFKMAKVTGSDFLEATKYTMIYRDITGGPPGENNESAWDQVRQQIRGQTPEEITKIIFDTYQAQPHSKYDPNVTPDGMSRFGAL